MKSLLFWLCLIPGALWAGTALWVQFPGARLLVLGLFGVLLAGLVFLWFRFGNGWAWGGFGILALLIAGWYLSLTPRQNRDWAPDVAHIMKGHVEGDIVTLENVRDFRWNSPDTTTQQRWETRIFDLSKIEGVDMVTSVWDNPDIAHLLVSFRFTDQRPVTFSVEIRREMGESFSVIGGFFRQFELSLIAADEADIIQWRAVPRGEEVRLYPLTLTPEQAREVFLRYVALGNGLNETPRWYNTATANCTTVVWQLSKVLSPDLPLDPSLLLSGRLPQYLDKFHALAGSGSLDEKRARALISERARNMPQGADFSAWVRGE